MAAGDIFINLGSGGSATTGANAQSFVGGDNTTVTNDGTGCTDGIHCDGVTVTGTNETVSDDGGSAVTINGNNDTITGGAGSYVGLATGDQGDTVTDNSGGTIAAGNGVTGTIIGTGDTITAGTTDYLNVSGNNDTITEGTGGFLGLIPTDQGDIVTASSDTISAGNGVTATITGSNDSIGGGTSDYLNISGGSDQVTEGSGGYLGLLQGDLGDTVTASADHIVFGNDVTGTVVGSSDAINGASTDNLTVDGGGDTIGLGTGDVLGAAGGGNTITSSADDLVYVTQTNGAADMVNAAGDQFGYTEANGQASGIYIASNAQANVSGNNDGITLGTGDILGAAGGGDTINAGVDDLVYVTGTYGAFDTIHATGDQTGYTEESGQGSGIYLDNNAQANVSGGTDSVNLGTGDNVGLIGGNGYVVSNDVASDVTNLTAYTGATITGSGGYIGVLGSDDAVNASNETISAVANDQGEAVSGTGDTVYEAANDAFNVSGGHDTVDLTSTGDYVGLLNGSGNIVYNDDAGDIVNLAGSTDATITGGGGTVGVLGSNDAIVTSNETINTVANDKSESLSGTGDTLDEAANNGFNVAGGYDTIDLTSAGDYVGLLGGAGYDVIGSKDVVDTTSGTSFTLNGNNDDIAGSNDHINITGSYDDTAGSGDTINPNGADDYASGSGDSDPDGSGSGGGGGYGYYGFTQSRAGQPPGIDVIAQYDVAHGYTQAAQAAQAAQVGLDQAAASANGDLATSAATLALDPTGPVWGASTVTWGFATGPTGGASPFSGAIDAAYQATIVQALQTWAAATGLTFTQASSPGNADIQIGWGSFDTAASDVVGYTSLNRSNGVIQPGATVRLEDPDQTPLITGADGQLFYADSGASLYQVALHEIGHALGLSEDSDPNSVMYDSLGANNQTLDSTDMAAAHLAYGMGGTQATLIQAMAAFGATTASPLLTAASQTASQAHTLAGANPH
ncbi:beta strand repeat-containing protein [Rhodopila sp.]|uniref:beta strand repeat-containing protein n=1 Tax=Rhodopila sp. TaxID=2480087 RepID=UPI003D137736